jgi:hypothetical protein
MILDFNFIGYKLGKIFSFNRWRWNHWRWWRMVGCYYFNTCIRCRKPTIFSTDLCQHCNKDLRNQVENQ